MHVIENISDSSTNHSKFQSGNKKPWEISKEVQIIKLPKYLSTKWNWINSNFVPGLVREMIILIFPLNMTWGQEIVVWHFTDFSQRWKLLITCSLGVKFYTQFPNFVCILFTCLFRACISCVIYVQFGGFTGKKHTCNAAIPVACAVLIVCMYTPYLEILVRALMIESLFWWYMKINCKQFWWK